MQAELTRADDHAESRAAIDMLHRHSPGSTRRLTLAADRGHDSADVVAKLRRRVVTPHVAQKSRPSAIDGRTTRHPGYAKSQRRRTKIEDPFGGVKTVGGRAQTLYRGIERVRAPFTLATGGLQPREAAETARNLSRKAATRTASLAHKAASSPA